MQASESPLDPAGRLRLLCDGGSVQPLPAPATGEAPTVIAARGRVGGRPVVCYAQDSRRSGGAVGAAEAEVVVTALRLARRERVPLVGFLESAGARLQEGAAALAGFGRIFFENVWLSRTAPQISVITGMSAGGGCYSPALTDFTVMTRPSAMFLTGPRVVREAVGEEISATALGGPEVHERSGVCHYVADDDHAAVQYVRDLLGYLGGANGHAHAALTAAGQDPDPSRHVPALGRRVYDIRDVVRDVVDDGRLLEIAPRWARNIVVGFARLGGRPVGIVANQPRHLGGIIDVSASEKGARFVETCERFRVPLAVFVDTPGFMPGSSQESAGIIRHGASLVRAFAAATVPRLTVVVRKAFGGAYITMNSKDLGADLALAWPGAEIGIMAPHAAVRIVHRRRIAAEASPETLTDALAAEYADRHIAAARALELGAIDAVIHPHRTRTELIAGLRAAFARRGQLNGGAAVVGR